MTKCQLFQALGGRGDASKVTIKGVSGWISSVQREDGSGSSFNVTLYINITTSKTVYVRTID